MTTESVEDRLARLEDIAFQGDGLERAVNRLGVNATALGDVLLTVDRNQQQLSKLGSELNQVRETTATKTDIAAQVQRAEGFRKRVLTRITATAILLFLGALGLVAYQHQRVSAATAQRQQLCAVQSQANTAIQDFVSSQKTIERQFSSSPALTQRLASLDQLASSFPLRSCRGGK